ncbi:MAG TPA: 4-alpha-glucanotransferase, partial [Beijerinckiaceae bacterium]|nr:4-alpha-glucanotransferase [Beijerinckiaceae bacterium]
MSEHDALIDRIAALVGIAPVYTDVLGRQIETRADTQRAILSAFGLAVGTEAEARDSLARVGRLRRGPVPALIPVEAGQPARIPARLGIGAEVRWRLIDESGGAQDGRAAIAADTNNAAFDLPPLAAGYHRLTLEAEGGTAEATVIAAPSRCWEPDDLRTGARRWGVTAQVYSLRSTRDFGVGGYAEVAQTAERAGIFGASFLGLSPVHALFEADRTKISPYSPSSRLFLESIFIEPRLVEGFPGSEAARLFKTTEFQERLASLREGALVDYAAVWALKRPLLDALWADFRARSGDPAFDAFRRSEGEALEAHATFEALSEYFRYEGRWWLGDWPGPFRDARSDQVKAFAADHAERIAFHAWLQWLADTQLAAAAARAEATGMGIGLYRDLAVAADPGGSEIWAAPERFAAGLSVGAPPDPLGPQGQKWGIPPFDPLTLERQGLAAFRALVQANMRHAGAIRIDHAFQLQRLFLIPRDAPAAEGAYVAYPFEAMLATLRLESHRAGCLVIAEDLGTGPEGFSDAIMASGVLSYRVVPFEREAGGAFKRPDAYPRSALAVATTHDLPTLRGWWRGLDIDLRQTLGVYDPATAERERAGRAAEHRHFAAALAAEDILPTPEPPDDPPLEATVRYLARTASALAGVQIEDAAGELNQANMPGLDQGHPNWRRRLSTDIETLTAPGGDFAKLAAIMAEEGRGERLNAGALAAPPPRATYRLQFHQGFTFDHAAAIVPYLAQLGVSHVYASPIARARSGSTHGYDIVDHAAVNPELGGEDGFVRLSDALRAHGLGLVLDIVPNHMGVGGADNGWWLSALEWGELSPFAKAFDIDWERLGANHKLIIP